MITKDDILKALSHEWDVCTFLAAKIPPERSGYRPTESQRSVVELLRYIAYMPVASVRMFLTADFKHFAACAENVKEMTMAEFPQAVAAHRVELLALFDGLTEEEFFERMATLPTREQVTFDVAMMMGPVKWAAAYKMQLFLYAKLLGRVEMGTMEAWAGIDPPVRP